MTDSERHSQPIFAGKVSQVGFRLEAMFEENQPAFRPEDLVGKYVELQWPGGNGILGGRVVSVEPYVDAKLGPGHWVEMGPPA